MYKMPNKMPKMNESNELELNMDIFIVPNPLAKIGSFVTESMRKFVTKVNEMNGGEDINPEKSQFVELWYTSTDTDNLVDHGMKFLNKDALKCFMRPEISAMPVSLFKDLKEGETIKLKAVSNYFIIDQHVARRLMEDDKPDGEVILNLNLTASQLKYRYKDFGKFEELIFKLMRC